MKAYINGEYVELNDEYIEEIRKMCLFDDSFMTTVFSDVKLAEYLIRILLDRKDLVVTEAVPQFTIKNLFGRSVRLDIYAKDSEGNVINVEVQRENSGAKPRRARYNNSLMDAHCIEAGTDFDKLPETYVIFITESDYFKMGKELYKIERMIEGCNKPFNDGTHILYINGQNRDDTKLGHLMWDFAQLDPENMKDSVLAEAVRHYKYNEEGLYSMCKIMDDLVKKENAIAVKQTKIQFAKKAILNGKMTFEEIAEMFELSLDEVKALAEKTSA